MYRIWIVEDEENLRKAEEKFLNRCGYLVSSFESAEDALEKLSIEKPEIIFLDLNLPGISGEEMLNKLKERNSHAKVIIISAYSELDNVISVMKIGAYDFIKKPFDLQELRVRVEKVIENINLEKKLSDLKGNLRGEFIRLNSAPMAKVNKMIEHIGETPGNTTVLITGESGSGKEYIASLIHKKSKYSTGEFVEINCSSFPENLLESELFGHVKGAFTDAYQDKKGLFEVANKGTLFLDEIGDMPLNLQSKLLKVIENKVFKRVGGIKDISVDLRIIAATNKDLSEEVKNGNFREDLFYRINVFPIHVPPLRERKEDIIPLSEFFVEKYSREFRKNDISISKDDKKILLSHDWPGNIRELKNVIERGMILAESGKLSLTMICDNRSISIPDEETEIPDEGIDLEDYLNTIEKGFIMKALEKTGWNQSKAAALLGMQREILRYRMKKYGIK